ncbi:MAG: Protein of unknown function precursor [Bacteroidetes bacterium]|nr:Protein of unknown function precursor [Bacteroidota bacterium]
METTLTSKSPTLELQWLRSEFGRYKEIPEKYEEVILTVLSHYPELKDTCIRFVLKDKHPVPYGTMPSLKTIFSEPAEREYIITIREQADYPTFYALFKNLTEDAKKAVIAHEVAHVMQYSTCSKTELMKFMLFYLVPEFQEKVEKAADMEAIIRGFGHELLEQAIYLRAIPGYVEERPAININYLKPQEIVEYLPDVDD